MNLTIRQRASDAMARARKQIAKPTDIMLELPSPDQLRIEKPDLYNRVFPDEGPVACQVDELALLTRDSANKCRNAPMSTVVEDSTSIVPDQMQLMQQMSFFMAQCMRNMSLPRTDDFDDPRVSIVPNARGSGITIGSSVLPRRCLSFDERRSLPPAPPLQPAPATPAAMAPSAASPAPVVSLVSAAPFPASLVVETPEKASGSSPPLAMETPKKAAGGRASVASTVKAMLDERAMEKKASNAKTKKANANTKTALSSIRTHAERIREKTGVSALVGKAGGAPVGKAVGALVGKAGGAPVRKAGGAPVGQAGGGAAPNACYHVEFSRSRVQCRTGLKGAGQTYGFKFGLSYDAETQEWPLRLDRTTTTDLPKYVQHRCDHTIVFIQSRSHLRVYTLVLCTCTCVHNVVFIQLSSLAVWYIPKLPHDTGARGPNRREVGEAGAARWLHAGRAHRQSVGMMYCARPWGEGERLGLAQRWGVRSCDWRMFRVVFKRCDARCASWNYPCCV